MSKSHAAAVRASAHKNSLTIDQLTTVTTREYEPLVTAAEEVCEMHSCICDQYDTECRPCEYCELRNALKEVVG